MQRCPTRPRSRWQQTLQAAQTENAAALRAVEVDRLDALQHALWDAAMGGSVPAARALVRIIEARPSARSGSDRQGQTLAVPAVADRRAADRRLPHARLSGPHLRAALHGSSLDPHPAHPPARSCPSRPNA